MSKHILRKRSIGFTTLSNPVIAILSNDLGVLGLYTYLLSKPDNWDFYKTKICSDCKIGIKKLDRYLKRLNFHGLVQYGQERNEKGRFEKFFIDIYDTETPISIINEQKQPVGQNCRTVKTVGRSGEAIKEEVIKEEILYKNKESLREVVDNSEKAKKEKQKRSLFLNTQKEKQKHKIGKKRLKNF